MPLAVQALLPFMALLFAAAVVWRRPRRPENGWIAVGATALAALVCLSELVRLAPGERVDVPYLTTFPYAELAIRLDALSLAFSAVTLTTAALLMLVRLRMPGDRRDPWRSWLLTSAAALAVLMAPSLLLDYILLQALTLAWSGTLDEGAPRHRPLRLAIGVADVGLLLAAASAIQSVGTSAFSGVPSDTFGPAAFLLALLPVVTRVAALGWPSSGPVASVAFEPAVVFAAPAGYLLLRLVAVMGGHLPGRSLEILVFSASLLVAAASALLLLFARRERLPTSLLITQAAIGLALLASSVPLLGVASIWIWLQLIMLTGLSSVHLPLKRPAGALALVALAMLPGSAAFIGLWIGAQGLRASGQLAALLAATVVVIVAALAALSRLRPVERWTVDVAAVWGAGLLVVAAFPALLLSSLVLPAGQAVRPVARGSFALSPFGFSLAGIPWPAPLATLGLVIAGVALLRTNQLSVDRSLTLRMPGLPRVRRGVSLPVSPRWLGRGLWTAFFAVIALAVLRP